MLEKYVALNSVFLLYVVLGDESIHLVRLSLQVKNLHVIMKALFCNHMLKVNEL